MSFCFVEKNWKSIPHNSGKLHFYQQHDCFVDDSETSLMKTNRAKQFASHILIHCVYVKHTARYMRRTCEGQVSPVSCQLVMQRHHSQVIRSNRCFQLGFHQRHDLLPESRPYSYHPCATSTDISHYFFFFFIHIPLSPIRNFLVACRNEPFIQFLLHFSPLI